MFFGATRLWASVVSRARAVGAARAAGGTHPDDRTHGLGALSTRSVEGGTVRQALLGGGGSVAPTVAVVEVEMGVLTSSPGAAPAGPPPAFTSGGAPGQWGTTTAGIPSPQAAWGRGPTSAHAATPVGVDTGMAATSSFGPGPGQAGSHSRDTPAAGLSVAPQGTQGDPEQVTQTPASVVGSGLLPDTGSCDSRIPGVGLEGPGATGPGAPPGPHLAGPGPGPSSTGATGSPADTPTPLVLVALDGSGFAALGDGLGSKGEVQGRGAGACRRWGAAVVAWLDALFEPSISAVYSKRVTVGVLLLTGVFSGLCGGLLGTSGPPQIVSFAVLKLGKVCVASVYWCECACVFRVCVLV
jgi:hypothetical protein